MHFEEVAYGTLKAFDICQAQPVRVGRTMCSLKHEGEGKRNKSKKKKGKENMELVAFNVSCRSSSMPK